MGWYIALIILMLIVTVGMIVDEESEKFSPAMLKKNLLGVLICSSAGMYFLYAAIEKALRPESKSYEVVAGQDYTNGLRKRLRWYIYSPEAITKEQRIATGMEAAKKLLEEVKDVKEINILMVYHANSKDRGMNYLNLVYMPEETNSRLKHDIWRIRVTDYLVHSEQVMVSNIWETNKAKFTKDGLVDEEALTAFVAKKLEISKDEVNLPLFTTEKYKEELKYNVGGEKLATSIKNPKEFAIPFCKRKLSCWAERNIHKAKYPCKEAVEALAKYNVEWTDGILSPMFSRYGWSDQKNEIINYLGDQVKMQNGFGAWINMTYSCKYDVKNGRVADLGLSQGKLY